MDVRGKRRLEEAQVCQQRFCLSSIDRSYTDWAWLSLWQFELHPSSSQAASKICKTVAFGRNIAHLALEFEVVQPQHFKGFNQKVLPILRLVRSEEQQPLAPQETDFRSKISDFQWFPVECRWRCCQSSQLIFISPAPLWDARICGSLSVYLSLSCFRICVESGLGADLLAVAHLGADIPSTWLFCIIRTCSCHMPRYQSARRGRSALSGCLQMPSA